MTTTIPRTSAMLSFTASFIALSRCEPGAVHRPDLGATLTHEAPRRVEPQVLRRARRRTGGGYRALLIRVSKRPGPPFVPARAMARAHAAMAGAFAAAPPSR